MNRIHIIYLLLSSILSMGLLVGCGQKGPLELPEKTPVNKNLLQEKKNTLHVKTK